LQSFGNPFQGHRRFFRNGCAKAIFTWSPFGRKLKPDSSITRSSRDKRIDVFAAVTMASLRLPS
jgi:hypothetical protein